MSTSEEFNKIAHEMNRFLQRYFANIANQIQTPEQTERKQKALLELLKLLRKDFAFHATPLVKLGQDCPDRMKPCGSICIPEEDPCEEFEW